MKNDLLRKLNRKTVKALLVLLFTVFVTPAAFSQYGDNIMLHGGFEDGVSFWKLKLLKKSEGTLTTTSDAHSGDSAALFEVTSLPTSGGVEKMMMYLKDSLPEHSSVSSYLVTVWAKAENEGMPFRFQMESRDGLANKKNRASDPIPLTTTYKQYKWFYTAVEGYPYFIPKLQNGAALGKYYYDDFMIQEVTGVPNGGFEEGVDFGWELATTGDVEATLTEENETQYAGGISAKIDVTVSDDTASHVVLKEIPRIRINSADTFHVNFYSKGSEGVDSIFLVLAAYSGSSLAYSVVKGYVVGQEWQRYTLDTTFADTISAVSFRFQTGKNTGTYFFDEVRFNKYVQPSLSPIPDDSVYVDSVFEYQVVYEGWGTFSVITDPEVDWLTINQGGTITGFPTSATPDTVKITVILDDGIHPDTTMFTLVVKEAPTGVAEILSGDEPLFYPNPAHGAIRVNAEPGSEIRIMDITGKIVVDQLVLQPHQSLDISHLTKGLYLVKCTYEKNTVVKKLIVR